ncbi:hypothetical protein FBU30_005004 [Linnemannia zychae]|nr:hypothetical protein FBU30_005004 [Linnemannia zychae]
MGILSSILRILPGFVTSKPNAISTTTPLVQVTDPAASTTGSTSPVATTIRAVFNLVNPFDINASQSSSSASSQGAEQGHMGTAATLASIEVPRIVNPIFLKTPNSTTARTMAASLPIGRQQPNQYQQTIPSPTKLSFTIVDQSISKRQDNEKSAPDIELAVRSMDLDKYPLNPLTTHQGQGGSAKTSIIPEDSAMVVCHKAVPHVVTTVDMAEETYPLVQNRMFDVPEIIRSIAEFLDKPSLAKCCRVSKFWATHCTPLLWRHIVDKHWRFSRFCASIQSQSHYIRSIKCEDWTDYEEMLLCQFPRLKGIAFHGSRESMTIREKILAKVSNTLMSLVLSSVASELSADSARAIQNLHQLTTLKIINMTISHRHLANILRKCENLEFLSLARIQLDDNSTSASGINNGEAGENDLGVVLVAVAKRSVFDLVPTRIKYLAMKEVTVSPEYLIGMIENCPNLLELSLVRNETLLITPEMIRSIQESCPQLYAVDVGDCKMLERETFTPFFTTLTNMTILNLSGTKVGDEDLLILGQKCRNIVRLDIQYCTFISSKGLHRFLSRCSSSLRHLEASGVAIDPETFDDRAWTCTKLEIMFVHIGLIGSYEPYIPSTAAKIRVEGPDSKVMEGIESTNSLADASHKIEPSLSSSIIMTNTALASTSAASSATATIHSTNATYHDNQRHCKSAGTSSNINIHNSTGSNAAATSTITNAKTLKESIGSGSGSAVREYKQGQEDVEMRHVLHPIQDVCNIQFLGLMGCGPKLNRRTPCPLLRGFQSVKRLHVLELYQTFKKEDLEWLVESLPELCRIDAEKYNISDDILGWFHATYPHVRIYRQE